MHFGPPRITGIPRGLTQDFDRLLPSWIMPALGGRKDWRGQEDMLLPPPS